MFAVMKKVQLYMLKVMKMNKMDTCVWKGFCVGELFDIHPTKAYKLTNSRLFDNGIYPVVVNSAYNNGIGGFTSKCPTENGNMITFSDTVDANTIFYQDIPFVGYAHVQGLYPIKYHDKWDKETLLFFVSSFRKTALSKGFDYGNKFRRDIAVTLNVKMPADNNGDPDWNYMRKHIKQIEDSTVNSINLLNNIVKTKGIHIDISKWGKFSLNSLFEISKGSRLTKAEMKSGNIKYIGASSFNNGVTCEIGNTEHIHPASSLTVTYNGSDIGRTFYQDEKFWATDDVNVLYPKFKMSKEIALFLAPIIKAVGGNHVYKDKWQIMDMKKDEIMLPITNNGTPDWEYMENYISKISSKINKYLELF